MLNGCMTALVTPFENGSLDLRGLDELLEFQISSGVSGVLAVGTTGESPTLTWEEHNLVIKRAAERARGRTLCVAGTGSNNTAETLEGTREAVEHGAGAVLLVDPYYNGPSSLEIRREYVEPVARAFPGMEVIPYVIPGRTGAKLLPQDLAVLARDFKNVTAVKEATGDLDNMRETRRLCGDGFSILSGDDALTVTMMADPDIRAAGVISVMSNIAPQAMAKMVFAAAEGDMDTARAMESALAPLFSLVTVTTEEDSPFGKVSCRARNPLPVKTLMAILGMPGGPCRRPLGKMTAAGVDRVLAAARQVWENNPEILQPAADHFGLDIQNRLYDPAVLEGLSYPSYA
ncbi:MAG: 4-hydroxy-tetrahydrodipicolinate synthase [Deltaproteobacteria bacterium]|nr:4-hydroxy-tetrahydrodipicolinate synthase [Deltaproteobacteria bacterium]